ncbi:MAG: DNA helicase RecQ [bacterium]|nr:DNA helicase RecQ [bacterium]
MNKLVYFYTFNGFLQGNDMIEKAKKILKSVFGYDQFRSLQEQVIGNIMERNDTLVIMPTGGGKSLCYQIPALLFDGLTIVISPLISLMKDQVGQLLELGVPTVLLNSSLTYEEYMYNIGKIRRNEAKLLYLAPETLMKQKTLDMLSSLTVPIASITIDEAHCISEWGHDFRPEYRQITEVRKRFPNAVCIALTATATERVREDIKSTLRFDQSNEFVASFDRDNLFLKIIPKQKPNNQVINFLKKYPQQPGIIYCFTRRQVDELTGLLEGKGFSVKPYHAGLAENERRINQEMFLRDDVQIIVATVAFGMGINKSNIRFVVHYDLPKNIESYYQEIGRAGRDGLRADCLLLFGYGDLRKIRFFIDQKEEQEKRIASIHLSALLRFAEAEVCRRIPLLNYFAEEYTKENCQMCDNCLQSEIELTDITIPAQKFLSCVRKTKQIFGASYIVDVLRGSKAQRLLNFHHDRLSTYGIGKDISKNQWLHLSRQFIQKGLLLQDQEYGSLKVTQKGLDVLKGQTLMGIFHEDDVKETKSAKVKPTIEALQESDRELFELLRKKRKQLADRNRVAPFMIFSDKSLVAMAGSSPARREDLLDLHGVGNKKLEKYGDTFYEIICNYRGLNVEPSQVGALVADSPEPKPYKAPPLRRKPAPSAAGREELPVRDIDALPAKKPLSMGHRERDVVSLDEPEPPGSRDFYDVPIEELEAMAGSELYDTPPEESEMMESWDFNELPVKEIESIESPIFNDAPVEEIEPVEATVQHKRKYRMVGDAFNRGATIDELMQEFSLKEDTVLNHLYRYLKAGSSLNPGDLLSRSTLSPSLQADVMEAFASLGTGKLKPVHEKLNGKVDYTQIKLLQVYYLSCNS